MDTFIPLTTFLALGLLLMYPATIGLQESERKWLMRLTVVALLARLAAATVFATVPSFRLFHEDAEGYEITGIWLADAWRGEGPPYDPEKPTNYGYFYFCGILDYVFGRYKVVPSYFNAMLGSFLPVLIYRLTTRMFHPLVARRAALLVALMPSMILWSSLALKDVIVTFAIVIAMWSCMSLKERITPLAVLGIVGPLAAIFTIRFYISYFVAFAVVLAFFADRGRRIITGIYKQIFLGATVVALFALLGFTQSAGTNVDYFTLENASQYRLGMASSAQSGFDVGADISTPGSALAYLPIGMAHLLMAPFPWQMTSLRSLLAAPETILWWFLIPATIRGMAFSIRRRFAVSSPLLIFAVTLTMIYSIVQGNIGTAFRQRAQILVFLFIFCAVGLYQKRCQQAGIDPKHLLAGESAPAAQGAT